MLAQNLLIKLHHFKACYYKTFLLKAADDVAYETTMYGRWFDYN